MAKPKGKLQISRIVWGNGDVEWQVNDGFYEDWADTWPEALALAERWIRNG